MVRQKSLDTFKEHFDALAVNGFIGDPNGELAYLYMRVSSEEQGEEGRSGLPRQIGHCHEIASQQGYKIPWDFVFADEHTGFEFDGRPSLSRLRKEYKSIHPRAQAVIIEHLDRLSRNADWHQGFLLDEMKQHHIHVVFWKAFNSRVERAVMGAIAQDGMELARDRMAAGTRQKARSGRVTAHNPAYGFKLVDSKGIEGPAARKDSHYAIHEEQAVLVRYIFSSIGVHGKSLRSTANELNTKCPPPRGKFWRMATLAKMIKNPVYKGQFVAHRFEHVMVERPSEYGFPPKKTPREVERPEDEWIIVPVPPIVSPELWQLANDVLKKNKQMEQANAKHEYLLVGVLKCATCGFSYHGYHHRRRGGYYRCTSKMAPTKAIEAVGCHQGVITCHFVDAAVWHVVSSALLEPKFLIDALDDEYNRGRNQQLTEQAKYISAELQELENEAEKQYRAYINGVWNDAEYAEHHQTLKERRTTLREELAEVQRQIMTEAQLTELKQNILLVAEKTRESGLSVDAPFALKRQIIKLIVDRINLDVANRQFEIEGALRGTWLIDHEKVTTLLNKRN